jgi:energy-converting hydrogenase Eha subunit E
MRIETEVSLHIEIEALKRFPVHRLLASGSRNTVFEVVSFEIEAAGVVLVVVLHRLVFAVKIFVAVNEDLEVVALALSRALAAFWMLDARRL